MKPKSGDHRSYWLFDWLDKHDIHSPEDASKFLSVPRNIFQLRDLAQQDWQSPAPKALPGINLFAGAGLDLDSILTCPSISCRKHQIDVLFRHALHYFDTIQLPDSTGSLLVHYEPQSENAEYLDNLVGRISVAMYLRDIGATDLIQFTRRHPVNSNILDRLLKLIAFDPPEGISHLLIHQIIDTAQFHFEVSDDNAFSFKVFDPSLGIGIKSSSKLKSGDRPSESLMKHIAAQTFLHDHIKTLAHDLQAFSVEGGTFGSTIWSHRLVLDSLVESSNPNRLAVSLELPSLSNVPLDQLIRIRLDEQESFHRFRDALRVALREKIKSGSPPATSAVSN